MDDRSKELMKREMWTWIGSFTSIFYHYISYQLGEKFCKVNLDALPKVVSDFLATQGYLVIKYEMGDMQYGLYCFIWVVSGLVAFYHLCCFANKSGGFESVKGLLRGVLLWGTIVSALCGLVLSRGVI